MTPSTFIQVPYREMNETFFSILRHSGFSDEKAKLCADVFAINSLEGIYTHGVNRFTRFIQYANQGFIKFNNDPRKLSAFGCIEQWDGQLGPGPTNALQCTDRSMEIARTNGLGCVALSHTNHWMRGGYYGWQAARKGFIFIGWTNTIANMPTWGGTDPKLGNNPLVIAIPYQNEAIVLDMAMSQYSYGSLELYSLKNQMLPLPGGFDSRGELSYDADAIMHTRRVLPIGYWKGAGLSLMLDILATILSGGLSTSQISKLPVEHSPSQIFFTVDISKIQHFPSIEKAIQEILDDYKTSVPAEENKEVRYPGERILVIRESNLRDGITVSKKVWDEVLALRKTN